jgi:uncharacterized repeat protein (TIGR03806 family)
MLELGRFARTSALIVAVIVPVLGATACGGSDESHPSVGGASGSAGAAGRAEGGAGAGGSGGGAAGQAGGAGGARYGLTSRPTNTTCKPPMLTDAPATKLSATGCVDPADPRKPASGLVPYTVNAPLWSDGAEKRRYFALPEGAKITVKDCVARPDACGATGAADHGDFVFPVGSVLVKMFELGGKPIETRLLVRAETDLWVGYSYAWRADGSDADVLPDSVSGEDRMLDDGKGGKQKWHYPSRSECLQCHTDAAGVALGPEMAQLDGPFAYPSGVTSPQLETLAAIGVFDAPLPGQRPAALVAPSGTAGTTEQRARSYLHANCAICHRPGSNFQSIDLRSATPLAKTFACNADPQKGDLGVAGAKILVAGDPMKSLVLLRMKQLAPSTARMPQIGTLVVDDAGVAAVEAWIRDLKSCP